MNPNQTVLPAKLSIGLLTFALVFTSMVARAQVTPTGTISGTVANKSDAVLPMAHVTVVNQEQNTLGTTMTNNYGSFRFPALPVGHYSIKVEAPGFAAENQNNPILNVGQEAVINFTLSVGSAVQQVEISVDTAQVDTPAVPSAKSPTITRSRKCP